MIWEKEGARGSRRSEAVDSDLWELEQMTVYC